LVLFYESQHRSTAIGSTERGRRRDKHIGTQAVPVTQSVGQKVENVHKGSSDGSAVSDVVRVTLLVVIVARTSLRSCSELSKLAKTSAKL